MTINIHKYIMAIILAGAMILAMGAAVQTVYAEDAEEYYLDYEIEGISTISCVLPDSDYPVHAVLKKDGQEVNLPDGASCEWSGGIMDAEDLGFSVTPTSTDGSDAVVHFPQIPEGSDGMTAWLSVRVVKGGETIAESDSSQIGVMSDFYAVQWPEINPLMKAGEEAKTEASVIHYGVGSSPVPCEVSFKWQNQPSDLDIDVWGPKDGVYSMTLNRSSTNADEEFVLTMKYKDPTLGDDAKVLSDTMHYFLTGFSLNLANSNVQVIDGDYFTVYEDNWCFVDEVTAKEAGAAMGVTTNDVYIVDGGLEQQFDSELFEMTDVAKYVGYNENTGDDIWNNASFPLTFDAKGTTDKNGNRTDGTSLYRFKVKAKDGNSDGWTGKTPEYTYLFVNSKYSLYNFRDYFVGNIAFADLAGYVKSWDKDPYERYEVPKGKVSKKLVIEIGKDKLTPGKEVTVAYRNDKTKKSVSSFPTAAGEYTLVVTGKAPYYGADTSVHLKVGVKNTMTVKGKTLKVKAKGKKVKKTKTYKVSKVLKVKKAKGKVTYKKLKGNKKITIASNGKVKVKKGLKKGTYKIKVKATAAGTDKYFPITKKVTFKIKVK